MKTVMTLAGISAVMAGAVAHAEPTKLDSRSVTMEGVSATLERYNDPASADPFCQAYGLLTTTDERGATLTQRLCGANGILAARQGDTTVFYVQLQGQNGAGLYRFVPTLGKGSVYDFKADALRITSDGTAVRVIATHNVNGLLDDEKWIWRLSSDMPKPIDKPRRYVID